MEGGANSADTLNYLVPPSLLPPLPTPFVLKGHIFFDIHWILMHSGWFGSIFPRHLKFLQIKEGYLISGWTHCADSLNCLVCPSLLTKILGDLLDINALSLKQKYLSHAFQIFSNSRGGRKFFRWNQFWR